MPQDRKGSGQEDIRFSKTSNCCSEWICDRWRSRARDGLRYDNCFYKRKIWAGGDKHRDYPGSRRNPAPSKNTWTAQSEGAYLHWRIDQCRRRFEAWPCKLCRGAIRTHEICGGADIKDLLQEPADIEAC